MSGKRKSDDAYSHAKRRRPNGGSSTHSSTATTLTRSLSPSTTDDDFERKDRGGLNVELHPLLRTNAPAPVVPKSYNPVLNSKVRDGFQPSQLNPYLNQEDMALAKPRTHRSLVFNQPGKYVQRAQELREKLKEQRELEEAHRRQEELGLTPDEAIGEQYYKLTSPPVIEWWDKPYVKENSYARIEDSDNLTYLDQNDEDCPITIYIQHPVPIQAPWEKHIPPPKPLFLTKQELKRIRRNARAIRHKEKQDRIRLGLDPAPQPKVKLKNLMNVLTNDAIKNPTAVEMRVKSEVAERKRVHEETNEARKLTPEERHQKESAKREADLERGVQCCVYKINRLVNPKHVYKVDINAKQLDLKGMVINLAGGFSLVVTEGGAKAVNQYKKLLTRRINWTENEPPKNSDPDALAKLEDLSGNKCQIVWEGEVSKLHFHRWTIENVEDSEVALGILGKYRLDNYWRQACAM